MLIRDYIGLILSISVTGAMLWSCSFEIEEMLMEELAKIPGGRYKFLTILNLYLQIFYYLLCIINFFFGTNTIVLEKRSILQKLRDFLFAGAAFPIATFVCFSFWGLYHFDRKFIFPEDMEKIFSPILNHIMHTLPAVAIWMENLFHYHRYPSRVSGLLCILTLTGSYTAWVYYLHHIHWVNSKISFWIYPILNELSFVYRGLFFLGSALFSIGLYLIGEMYTLFLTTLRIDKAERNKKQI